MEKKRLTDPSQVPSSMTEREEAEFWSSHEITKEFLDKTERAKSEELPPRSRAISIRFDEDILQRLRDLAAQKGKKYQTLLKEFVIERLYEEEKWLQRKYVVCDQFIYGAPAAGVTSPIAKLKEAAVTSQSLVFGNTISGETRVNGAQGLIGHGVVPRGTATVQCSRLFQSVNNNSGLAVGQRQNVVDEIGQYVAHGSD